MTGFDRRSTTDGTPESFFEAAAAFHAVGHVIDHDLGGSPASDIPTFSLLAIVLLATA